MPRTVRLGAQNTRFTGICGFVARSIEYLRVVRVQSAPMGIPKHSAPATIFEKSVSRPRILIMAIEIRAFLRAEAYRAILQPHAPSPASQAPRRSPGPTIHHSRAIIAYFWKNTILVLIFEKSGQFLALI